jgi:paraquat-inducible protein B
VSNADTEQDDRAGEQAPQELPTAKVRRHGRFSWVWLIPIVAAGLVAYLAYDAYANHGPLVTLSLSTADGLSAEQTQVKHKAVPLGTVEGIVLAPDHTHVIVKIRMVGAAESMLTDHARFWVVRPRLSAGNLSGLDTLVSGAYIEIDPGTLGGKKERAFTALEQPPGRQSDEPGHVYVLKASRIGSLSAGSPVYYRDVEVGEMLAYELGDGLGPVTLRIFVRAPYDKFVHPETRFWNASGLSVTMGPQGMHFELESIQSVLSGGIAFETPRENEHDPPAADGIGFSLYDDKATADAAFYRDNIPCVAYFETSVQGLSRGSPVQLFGVQVGSVNDVKLAYDADGKRMVARVAFDLQPERVVAKGGAPLGDDARAVFAGAGLRVVLESSSLLTGAKDLAIRYAPGVHRGNLPREGDAVVLPSQGVGIEAMTASLADVAAKVDKIPFEEIAHDASAAMKSVDRLATQIDTNTAPALAQLPAIAAQLTEAAQKMNGALGPNGYGQSSQFQRNADHVMSEVADTARSFRALADYLDRHPEALLRGRAPSTDR